MKKTILVLAIILFNTFFCKAQINKGSIFLGVNSNFGFNHVGYETSYEQFDYHINLKPYFERFVSNNLSFGVAINSGISRRDEDWTFMSSKYQNYSSINLLGLELNVKKYWFLIPRLAFSLSPAISSNIMFCKNEQTFNQGSTNTTIKENWLHLATIRVGALVMIKPNIGIEVQTSLFSFNKQVEDGRHTNTFNIFYSQSNLLSVNDLLLEGNLLLGVKYLINKPTEQ